MNHGRGSLLIRGQRVIEIGHFLLLVLFVAAAAQAAQPRWMSLAEALDAPHDPARLILLHVRAGNERDERADRWVAESATHEAIDRSYADMLLVRTGKDDPLLQKFATLQALAQTNAPRLLILDPGGGLVEEPKPAFRDFGAFAAVLAAMRHAAPQFASAAQLRQSGHAAAALLRNAEGLLDAGDLPLARDRFNEAKQQAQHDKDRATEQYARLGLANIEAGLARRDELARRRALAIMLDIAKEPADPAIAARAWLLAGHWQIGTAARGDAYRKAYELAPKPSPLADSARQSLELLGLAVPGAEAAPAGELRLIVPQRTVIAGDIQVSAVAPASAAHVEFYLDDARIAAVKRTSIQKPFLARLSLGSVPRTHTIKAVAFDAAGAPVGEASAALNERTTALSVRIVKPAASQIASSAAVELEPRVPDGLTLESVEIFWNDDLVANLTAPPFRTTVTLPSPHAFGYLRVVAHDSSGATAEDAKLINGGGVAEDMRVDAVELHAVVKDRAGRAVEGLTAHDFVVKEDGMPVEVQLRSAANDPITIGIALDTSSSMRATMMTVAEEAADFLRNALVPGDKTFVVVFDRTARLVQPLTDEREKVSASIFDLNAEGATAVWDSIVYALSQLRGVTGKRALLVFTDGIDNASGIKAEAMVTYAREAGVPVYVVLINDAWHPPEPMRRLAEESEGSLFRNPRQRDLPHLFAQVRDDTRGEYLLSFVSPSKRPRSEMRRITVEVPKRDATVRATSGYYAK